MLRLHSSMIGMIEGDTIPASMTFNEIPREDLRAVSYYCACGQQVVVATHAGEPPQWVQIFVKCAGKNCTRWVPMKVPTR